MRRHDGRTCGRALARPPPRDALALRSKIAIGSSSPSALLVSGARGGAYIPAFAQWVNSLGVWGPVVFMLGYALATVALLPGSLLTLAAGAIFGIGRGVLYVFIAAVLGSAARVPGLALPRARRDRAAHRRQSRASPPSIAPSARRAARSSSCSASRRCFRSRCSTTPSGSPACASPTTSSPRSACCPARCCTCTTASSPATSPRSPAARRSRRAPATTPCSSSAWSRRSR